MKKLIMLAVTTLLCASSVMAQVNFVNGDTDALKALSQKSGKLVFIDLYADWCPPCRTMSREVFTRKDVGDFMSENFIAAKYNVDEELGKTLSREYSVSSIPTFLVFNGEGELVGRMVGGMSYDEFINNMKEMLTKIKSEAK